MDAVSIVAQTITVQRALGVIATFLALTAYLFPEHVEIADLQTFDIIIVGGGTAGIVLADRLTECGRFNVFLLEAGGDPPLESLLPSQFLYLPHTKYDFNYTSENDYKTYQTHKIRALNLTCGRVLGGGSSVNYMIYARGCPDDYWTWSHLTGYDEWGWDGVFPYFLKSENLVSPVILNSPLGMYHGTNGFLKVTRENRSVIENYLRSFEEVGKPVVLDINGPSSIGYTPQLVTVADGTRQSTAYAKLARIKNRPNLFVSKNSFVTKIIIDDENVARGVEFVTEDKRSVRALARREVILSAGTFNSARLLMLSGVGPRDHLEKFNIKVKSNLPVGYNYHDHVTAFVAIRTEKPYGTSPPTDPQLYPFPIFSGYVSLNALQSCPDYQSTHFAIPKASLAPLQLFAFHLGFEDDISEKVFEAGKDRNLLITGIALLHPRSRGRVTLRSRNPFDPPVIEPRTFDDKRDLDDLANSVADYVGVLKSSYFKSINAEFVDFIYPRCSNMDGLDYWRCYVLSTMTTIWHYVGTCPLGPVVDRSLRVRGVKRLRVVDASVMPRIVGGNTNAVVVMIAEKAADIIKNQISYA